VADLLVVRLDGKASIASLGPQMPPPKLNALAFFIGIFPQIGVQILEAGINKAFKGVVPSLDSRYPLSDFDGLTI